MKWIFEVMLFFILIQFTNKSYAQDLEILNGIQPEGFHYVAVKEHNKIDTIAKYAFECILIENKINDNVLELIMESPLTFDYLRLIKENETWVRDNQKSGQIASNPKYMSFRPANFDEFQPNRETFKISDNEILFEMLNKEKIIIQIKQIEIRNLERLIKNE